MLRNKRYNYACQEVLQCEEKNKKLKRDIKMLKEDLIHLKNNLLVQEKDKTGREIDVELSTNPEEEKEINENEKKKNKNLLELGKKYNDVEKAYQLVLQNISLMIETEKKNPLNVIVEEYKNKGGKLKESGESQKDQDEGDNKEIEQLELTNNELKRYNEVEFGKDEKDDLNNFTLTEEENAIIERDGEFTEKEIEDNRKLQLNQLDKIIKKNEENVELTEDDKKVIDEIINIELTEEEEEKARKINLTEEEEKIATQKLKSEGSDKSSDDKKEYFKQLKLKYDKYKKKEKKENIGYKLKKMKKNKVDMIKDYEILLEKMSKTFKTLDLLEGRNGFESFTKVMGMGIDANVVETKRPQVRKVTKKGTRKSTRKGTNRKYLKTENYKIVLDKDEEDDKSNYDPDVKILNKFLKEQKKEKENFISGKTKVDEKK